MRSLLGVLNIFGSLLTWFALYFLLPVATALLYGEFSALRGFLVGAAVSIGGGVLLRLATSRYQYDLKPRDGYLLVTVGWLASAAVAAVPLLVDLPGISFTHAYFETMSGLSTTGATQLHDIDTAAACHQYLAARAQLAWRHGHHRAGGGHTAAARGRRHAAVSRRRARHGQGRQAGAAHHRNRAHPWRRLRHPDRGLRRRTLGRAACRRSTPSAMPSRRSAWADSRPTTPISPSSTRR